MANTPPAPRIPRRIRRALAGLRWRIRAYVVVEGLSLAVIWICLTFWAGLALDYLPVLLGADEMPRPARALVLAGIAIVLGIILYRWILRRAFVRMADRSMAILLERRHRQFRDSLITSVELTGANIGTNTPNARMLAETETAALDNLSHVRLSSIFDARPLLFSLVGAVVLVATIGGAIAADQRFETRFLELGFRRLYLLDNDPWPRSAAIEIVGLQVQRDELDSGAALVDSMLEFRGGRLKVARGASVSLFVRADAGAKKIPEVCSVYYTTAEGDRGRVNMTRVGGIREGFQNYRYDGKPLKGILSNVKFDVVGFDHRLRDYEIEVVDSPVVIEAMLDCTFPEYMVNEQLATWLPRTIPLTTATQLPIGTRFTLHAHTNKPLASALLNDTESGEPLSISLSEGKNTCWFEVPELTGNLSLELTPIDTDGIAADKPYRIYIVGVEDQPPTVSVRLQGIGTAVTPDVMIAIQGKIEDDYEVASSAFEVTVNDGEPRSHSFNLQPGGTVEASIDFREQRSESSGIKLQPNDRLSLTVIAADKYDLGDTANVGTGDHYQLEVVTPDKLLSMLEARELGLRRRFEQIQDEMTELRQSLIRVKNEGPATAEATSEPGVDAGDENNAESAVDRIWSLRLLRSQRARLQSEKSAQETLGVAASFGDIRAELINNRVDTEDRKQRLQTQVVAPLQAIGDTLFPELDLRLVALFERLDARVKESTDPHAEDAETVALAATAVEQTDEILLAIDAVLQSMLDIEDYNELLDRVRDLIADQEGLLDETKKAQKQQVLDLLQ
ncbi:MAG: hypothetical protein H6821_00490 [Planctomycetaceae bacterium]|nr:hypothetical protein [Planctomycetaceae bacterium]MCB9939546.1 hypothetical protein [Planctomycetaceae bacterium]